MYERASPADFRVCRELIAKGSKSFHAASMLLPAQLRDPAFALYAFCRVADDAVDAPGACAGSLARMQARLDAIYAQAPAAMPVDRALADVVRRFAIPRVVFDALLEGFVWDLAGRRYHSLGDVHAYGARVAGSVGAMMAALMGARTPQALARACDLGVAMQLTNIARDVGEDARAGRLYLPRDWLREAGVDADAFLAHPRPSPAIAAVTLRLLDAADALYAHADAGIAILPPSCRPAIYAARLIYAEIGARIRVAGGDSVSRRAVTPVGRKLALAARAMAGTPRLNAAALRLAPLAETAFLVDAVAQAPAPVVARVLRAAPRKSPWAKADESWGRVFDLFQDLENRRRYGPVQ
jgi:phytoene synthase